MERDEWDEGRDGMKRGRGGIRVMDVLESMYEW